MTSSGKNGLNISPSLSLLVFFFIWPYPIVLDENIDLLGGNSKNQVKKMQLLYVFNTSLF